MPKAIVSPRLSVFSLCAHGSQASGGFMPFGPRLPEADLRAMAREHIEAGRLPASLPCEISADYGTGVRCELCGREISRAEVEYQVNHARAGARFTLHVVREACWQLKCVGLITDSRGFAGRS
jgi:hypothetical protein